MRPKNYYYISQTKLDVLEPQLKSRARWLEITPKVELPGVSIEARFKSTLPAENSVQRLLTVLDQLRSRQLLQPLSQAQTLGGNLFYSDTAEWYHGLFAFKGSLGLGDEAVRAMSYLLWRPWEDRLVLLAGSPLHIVGEKIVRRGVAIYGTAGTWASVMNLATQNFGTGEPNLAALGSSAPRTATPIRDELPWLAADADELERTEETLPPDLPVASEALSTALLCVRYLSRLPKSTIELVFTPYRRLDFHRRADLPHWAAALLNAPDSAAPLVDFFWRCRTIYIGSPLYTASVPNDP